MNSETNELEIRKAFHKKVLKKYHKDENSIIIDELGILHGKNRIDIAHINEKINGYEIKSSKDNLKRLPEQIESYSLIFHRITLIVAEKFLNEIKKTVPEWCGIVQVRKGSKGAIHFKTIRRAKENPSFSIFHAAHLLWKDEAIQFAKNLDINPKNISNLSRLEIYKLLGEKASSEQLVKEIKKNISAREVGRFAQLQALYDDL